MLLVMDGQVRLVTIHALRAMYNLVDSNDAKQSIYPPGAFRSEIMQFVRRIYVSRWEGRVFARVVIKNATPACAGFVGIGTP